MGATVNITKRDDPSFPGGFAVLMAVYGRDDAELFERALDSVWHNTLTPDQFVLVVDGPVPPALDALITAQAQRPQVQVLRLAQNQGLAKALNAGLACVRQDWTVRADADDRNGPERFARLAAEVRRDPQLDMLGSAIQEVDREQRPLALRRTPLTHDEIIRWLPYRNPFNHMAVAYRTAAVRDAGGYPAVHLKEDYALWCLLATRGAHFGNLDEVLVQATAGLEMYRRRGGWRYIRSEAQMQRLMVSLGLKGCALALAHGLARSAVFALPAAARGKVYRRLLRSSP